MAVLLGEDLAPRSAWNAAWGSLADAVRAPAFLPQTFLALFVLNTLPSFARLGHDWTADAANPSLTGAEIGDLIINFAALLIMIPFWIGLVRFFCGARIIYPAGMIGLTCRAVGWSILLSVLFSALLFAVAILVGVIAAMLPPESLVSLLLMIAVAVFGFGFVFWAMLRLTTFYPNLALREPSPLRTSFRQTRGWTWYLVRAWLLLILLLTIFGLAITVPYIFALGITGLDLEAITAVSLQKQELLPRIVLSAVAGVSGTVFAAWAMAFVSRIYRRIQQEPAS